MAGVQQHEAGRVGTLGHGQLKSDSAAAFSPRTLFATASAAPATRTPHVTSPAPHAHIAVKAARSAGAIINRAALDIDILKVNTKNPNDFVTEVDHASERVIIDTLLEAYPGHGILAEESGRAHGAKHSDYIWIIDPLDGTTNFIHGLPTYAVSIALAHRGQVQQAVVYDPARNDLFYASKAAAPSSMTGGCASASASSCPIRWSAPAFPSARATTSSAT